MTATEKEKLGLIIDSIVKATEDNAMNWELRDSCFNSERRYNFRSYSIDKQTEFHMEVCLNESLDNISKWGGSLVIYNKGLVEGRKIISNGEFSVKKLEDLLFQRYVKPTLVVKKESDTLDSILGSIGNKQYMRDIKLDQILDDSEIKNESNKVPPTHAEIKESILKKLFG